MVDESPPEIRTITMAPVTLEGLLGLPLDAKGIVLFAHGSGSGRLSPRNNFVAQALREDGLATLLFDLLTVEEARDRRNVFDIELLARRLLTGDRLGQTGGRDPRFVSRIFRRQHRRGSGTRRSSGA